MKNDFTIVIQGRLNKMAFKQLEYYRSVADIVFSCWDGDDESLREQINGYGLPIVVNPLPSREFFKVGSLYHQVCTTHAGVVLSNTPFIIKTRCDEYFSNLAPIMEFIRKNPNKIIAASAHFAKTKSLPYHAGDHLFACKTQTAVEAFGMLKTLLENKSIDLENPLGKFLIELKADRPEQFITMAMLYANGVRDLSLLRADENMKDNYQICQMKNLGNLAYTCNGGGGTSEFINGLYPPGLAESGTDFDDINKIDQ